MNEVWIENNGYKISNYGKVTKKNSDNLQKMNLNHCGYVMCNVKFDDGFYARSVHRAVAYAFLRDTYREGLEVNHIDGNKENNRVDNLEWVTKSQNQQHEVRTLQQRNGEKACISKLTNEQAIEIYNECLKGEKLYKDIALEFGISAPEVSYIATGKKWKSLGLKGVNSKDKPIVGINIKDGSILEYHSARFAVKDGFSLSCISMCCRGKTKKHRGYRWMYKKDYLKLNS